MKSHLLCKPQDLTGDSTISKLGVEWLAPTWQLDSPDRHIRRTERMFDACKFFQEGPSVFAYYVVAAGPYT